MRRLGSRKPVVPACLRQASLRGRPVGRRGQKSRVRAGVHRTRKSSRFTVPAGQLRFAPDSPLEGDGFEPSVPGTKEPFFCCGRQIAVTERGQPKRVVSYAVPMVRIHLPPAESRRQPNLLARGPGLEVAAPIDCEPPVGLGYAPPQPRDRARGGARASPGNGAVHLHESVLGTAIHFGVMANPINVIGVVIRRPQLWVTVE